MHDRADVAEAGGTVVLAFYRETLEAVRRREFCRPADRHLLGLARDARISRVVAADPWRSRLVDVAKGRPLRSRSRQVLPGGYLVDLVQPRRIRRAQPTDIHAVKRSVQSYVRRIEKLARISPREKLTLVSFDPILAAYADAKWIDRKIYVGEDDHIEGADSPRLAAALAESYREIARTCHVVITVSDELGARVAPGRALTVPNGVDCDLWAEADKSVVGAGSIIPYAVYTGTVERRVDDSIFDEVLKVVPKVVVAGFLDDPAQRERLLANPRVEYAGPVTQAELVRIVANAAVGLIPHHVTASTLAMSPLKLFEYLAAGIPVVASDLPPLRGFGERVILCRERSEWAPSVERALGLGRQSGRELADTRAEVSWDHRIETLLKVITDSEGADLG